MTSFEVTTLDDALRRSYESILSSGSDLDDSSRGANREVTGTQILLTDPRARLSRYESRSTIYSALGEFLWYLAKKDDLKFIEHYAQRYGEFVTVEEGAVVGAYGPRLFAWSGHDQVSEIINLLKVRPSSKKAVIQIFDRNDLVSGHKDVPCTCMLQFLLREGKLHAIATMRSNDATLGLPHDVFAFTMLQELIARSVGAELGVYRHWVGSLHIYERDVLPRVEN